MWWVRCRPSPTAELAGLDSWEWRGPKDDFKASIQHLNLVEALKQLYIFVPFTLSGISAQHRILCPHLIEPSHKDKIPSS